MAGIAYRSSRSLGDLRCLQVGQSWSSEVEARHKHRERFGTYPITLLDVSGILELRLTSTRALNTLMFKKVDSLTGSEG